MKRIALIALFLLAVVSVAAAHIFPVGGGALTSALCPSLGSGCFINVSTSANYTSSVAALAAAANSNTLHYLAMPSGIANYTDGGALENTGLTINIDPGAIFNNFLESTGHGTFTLDASNQTINGGTVSNSPRSSGTGAFRVNSNAANPTFNGTTAHDCNASCYLTGFNDGTVTLTNVTAYNGGLENCTTGGQDHNIYVSASGYGDTTSASISGILSYDETGGGTTVYPCTPSFMDGGWTLKVRPGSSTITGATGFAYIGCQHTYCEQNGVVDYPCSGNHTVSHVVLEAGPTVDNYYMVRVGEEITATIVAASISGTTLTVTAVGGNLNGLGPGVNISGAGITAGTQITADGTGSGGTGTYTVNNSQTVGSEAMTTDGFNCPHLGFYATNTLTISNVVLIWDSANGFGNEWIPLVCIGKTDLSSNACSTIQSGITVIVQNSDIVGNSTFSTFGSCSRGNICYGPSVVDGGGNHFYASRAAYATAKGLNFTDQFGNSCTADNGCSFPAIPPAL